MNQPTPPAKGRRATGGFGMLVMIAIVGYFLLKGGGLGGLLGGGQTPGQQNGRGGAGSTGYERGTSPERGRLPERGRALPPIDSTGRPNATPTDGRRMPTTGRNGAAAGWSMNEVETKPDGTPKTGALKSGTTIHGAPTKGKGGWTMEEVDPKTGERVKTSNPAKSTQGGWSMEDVPKKDDRG